MPGSRILIACLLAVTALLSLSGCVVVPAGGYYGGPHHYSAPPAYYGGGGWHGRWR